jgi:hypothetical protein
MMVLSDTGFHAAAGDPANLKLCEYDAWEDRLLIETGLSLASDRWCWSLTNHKCP